MPAENQPTSLKRLDSRWVFIALMAICVAASNYLVQFPVQGLTIGGEEFLTYGAFTYPFVFIVNETCNYWHGRRQVYKVIGIGFVIGVGVSLYLSSPRIALASGATFLISQWLDANVFSYFSKWRLVWRGLISAQLASIVDTFLFFALAFAFTDVPWQLLSLGDYGAKVLLDLVMLVPLRLMISRSWQKVFSDKPYEKNYGTQPQA